MRKTKEKLDAFGLSLVTCSEYDASIASGNIISGFEKTGNWDFEICTVNPAALQRSHFLCQHVPMTVTDVLSTFVGRECSLLRGVIILEGTVHLDTLRGARITSDACLDALKAIENRKTEKNNRKSARERGESGGAWHNVKVLLRCNISYIFPMIASNLVRCRLSLGPIAVQSKSLTHLQEVQWIVRLRHCIVVWRLMVEREILVPTDVGELKSRFRNSFSEKLLGQSASLSFAYLSHSSLMERIESFLLVASNSGTNEVEETETTFM